MIDRRSDDWNSVRTVFQKIGSLFPAQIREIYLLHQPKHLQPQLQDKDVIAHQLIQEFHLDFDIYVMDDQSELHNYINIKNLPAFLGGDTSGEYHKN